MSYEAWRISFQSSEQAARAAYEENRNLRLQLKVLQEQKQKSSWEGYVDRASGAFTQDEIESANTWR